MLAALLILLMFVNNWFRVSRSGFFLFGAALTEVFLGVATSGRPFLVSGYKRAASGATAAPIAPLWLLPLRAARVLINYCANFNGLAGGGRGAALRKRLKLRLLLGIAVCGILLGTVLISTARSSSGALGPSRAPVVAGVTGRLLNVGGVGLVGGGLRLCGRRIQFRF